MSQGHSVDIDALLSAVREAPSLGAMDSDYAAALGQAIEAGQLRHLPGDHTNTAFAVPVGDKDTFVQVFATPLPGAHPAVEIPKRLHRAGFDAMAPMYGHVCVPGQNDTVWATFSGFLSRGRSGWDVATDFASQGRSFADDAEKLGAITARFHAALSPSEMKETTGTQVSSKLVGRLSEEASLTARALELAGLAEEVPLVQAVAQSLSEGIQNLATDSTSMGVQLIHGDLHLGNTLQTDGTWYLLDFEGEPDRSLAQRFEARSPLYDIAGMLRSFAYAVGRTQAQSQWAETSSQAYVQGYLLGAQNVSVNPQELEAYVGLKAMYEIRYELKHRPHMVAIPLAYFAKSRTKKWED
ncbi:MAG: phosphotransferase [Actinomycetaceae bacterium]|nr:phosphotransferase [Actinomycetaceae bacterium]